MAEAGEKKRKLELDFTKLLSRDDDPPLELLIQDAAEKSMPAAVDEEANNSLKNLSRKDLIDKIHRCKKFQTNNLPDKGEKLAIQLKKLEAELQRRTSLEKDDNKSKKVITLADDESTCNGDVATVSTSATDVLSHHHAPPSKPASEFSLRFGNTLDNDRGNVCFAEELSTLKRSDPKRIREHTPFSTQITQKKDLSSRQTPFRSPTSFSANIENRQKRNGERGSHSSSPSSHPSEKDASCHLRKMDSRPYNLRVRNSRRNNKTVVLVDEEELEVDIVDETDQLGESFKDARIYYPSRNNPEAIEIHYSDMDCLSPGSYLSSPIMNFYIRYLQKPTSPRARMKLDYHVFNTYFYEKLKQDVLSKTDREDLFLKFRRWWKGVNIFEKAYIILPIHEEHHWSLVIICIPSKEDESGLIILHLDSLGLHNSKSIFSNVKSFLVEEWNFLRKEEVLELPFAEIIWNRLPGKIEEKVIEVPQQKNLYDCGLFVLFFMERFMEEAPERLKKLDSEMFGRDWFKPGEASSLRRKLRDLLRIEFKNAKEKASDLDS